MAYKKKKKKKKCNDQTPTTVCQCLRNNAII